MQKLLQKGCYERRLDFQRPEIIGNSKKFSAVDGALQEKLIRQESLRDAPRSKVIILGDPGIGKSSLLHRLKSGEFTEERVQNAEVIYDSYEHNIRLLIWDPAGSTLLSQSRQFYQDVTAVIVCFKLNDEQTFHNVKLYVDEIENQCDSGVVKFLVGLQQDTVMDDVISDELIHELKERHGFAKYQKTSAKYG